MIIGYSLGDLYLNEILGLGMAAHGDDFKVVIIDKFPSYINSYTSLFQHVARNPQAYTFVSRLAEDGLFVETGQEEYPLCRRRIWCAGGFKERKVDDVYKWIQRCGSES